MTEANEPMVEIKGLRQSFRKPGTKKRIQALKLDALTLERGSLTALTGPNGAGKTTLLHVIAGLARPTEGQVVVSGQDITKLKEAALDRFRAKNIGYILQDGGLIEALTAWENVMAAMLFAGRRPREQKERAAELLARLGLSHRLGHRPASLSGGERQRVALARALVNDPPLLLADEPMSSLDRASSEDLAKLLAELREEGRTMVVVTHHPDMLQGPTDLLELEPPPQRMES